MRELSGRRLHPVFLVGLTVAALGATGCYRVPEGKHAIADVEVTGINDLDEDDLLQRIDTREDQRFLGIFHGVIYEYELFDQYALRRDLQRVERFLRARGYYEARVYAARVVEKGNKVYVTIAVHEGEPVKVDTVNIAESSPVDEVTRRSIRIAIAKVLPLGAVLDEDKFAESETAALKGLTSSGHAGAKVTRHAEVDLVTHRARLTYTVSPGPFATFGAVTFEGLGELPESTVRQIFGVREGERYSSEDLDEGKQALLDLGVFGSVDVVTDLSNMETTHIVPVVVKAQRSKIRAFLAGGGVELDQLKTDVHVQVGWQNGNFLGGLRKLDLRFKPGIVLYPTRIDNLELPTNPLYEHRLSATLRQPGFIEKRTTGFARVEYNVYPVLLPKVGDKLASTVLGYHEPRGVLGAERKFLDRVFISPEWDIQANYPLDYLGHTEAEPLVISYVQLSANLDLRDDPNRPHRGFFLGNALQFSGGPILRGDAVDLRVQPDMRGYIPLPRRIGGASLPTMTLAIRGSVGFLFPFNYSTFSQANFSTGSDLRAEGSNRDYQVLFFRGFFSGGPSSNRGYPLRGVGPHDKIPYLSPAGQSASAGGCNPGEDACLLPTGGLSLWETNVELRINVSGPFSTAVFCDAGDVSPFQTDLRFDHPHLSCGGGARYDTPVGPIRLDIGYRLPGLQFPDGDKYELEPTPLFGAPIAVAFGIGETF